MKFTRLLMISAVSLSILSLLPACDRKGGGTGGAPSMNGTPGEMTAVLATTPNLAQAKGLEPGVQESLESFIRINPSGNGFAYLNWDNGMVNVVHNGAPGTAVKAIDSLTLSPDGKRVAYGALINDTWMMIIDGQKGVVSNEVNEPVFSMDGKHIAYTAKTGDKWQLVVDNQTKELTKECQGIPVFSRDGKKILYVEKLGDAGPYRLIVDEVPFAKRTVVESSGSELVTNGDHSRIAAVKDGAKKQRVVQLSFMNPDAVTSGEEYDRIARLAFSGEGTSLAYVAWRGKAQYLVLDGKEAPLPQGEVLAPPVIQPGGKGAGVLMTVGGKAVMIEPFGKTRSQGSTFEEAADLIYSNDGTRYAYAARRSDKWYLVTNGAEGPSFDKVVSPVFSPDGSKLLYRARNHGKRFLVVADATGRLLSQHPNFDMVFPPVFLNSGKTVGYGVKDGLKLIWKVESL